MGIQKISLNIKWNVIPLIVFLLWTEVSHTKT